MKVEGLGSLYYQRKLAEPKSAPPDGRSAGRQDQLTLSLSAQKAAEDTRLETVKKQERLDGIKARVENGTYAVPGEYVVDAILRRAGIGSGRI
ncbi:MAG: flagellar biosynthesis anti-sigma factor FlgM [Gracilibacteraceae bacterium]|jgi:anti-sigma28 factor (negative regulator of flagellin synthesis)|nr:flagellar biosynthesis anti-sigma factor FlgM [Gracilibacteraceae bacterium]